MFYNAFPNYLREELNIVLEILPKKTFNNVDISTSDEVIAYTRNTSLILENTLVEVCSENVLDTIEHLGDRFQFIRKRKLEFAIAL